jgi:hypothetical protein
MIQVRILNAVSAAAAYTAPGRSAITNASVGYQDVAYSDARRLVGQSFSAVVYAGKTTERPATLPPTTRWA